jgi:hypothetical protein
MCRNAVLAQGIFCRYIGFSHDNITLVVVRAHRIANAVLPAIYGTFPALGQAKCTSIDEEFAA